MVIDDFLLTQLMRDMQEPDASKIGCPELASRRVEIKHGEEITTMCQELQEERLKGIEKGIKKGIEKGVAETQLKCVKDVVEGFHVSIDEAFEKLHVPEKDRDAIRKKLNM